MANAGIPFDLAFDTRTSALACDASALGSSTVHTFSTMGGSQSKLFCPVTGARTFRQVLLRIDARWATSSGAVAITKLRYALQFAGAGFSANVDISGTALLHRAQSQQFTVDITAAVAAAFTSGTDIDFDVRVAFCTSTAGDVNSVTCSVDGIVEIDDASSRSMMTDYIVLDVPDSALGTSLTEVGTNQWANLSTRYPYANKTFLNIAFRLECNTNQAGGASHNLEYAIDGGAGVARATQQASTVDARFYDQWLPGASTSSAHALKMKSTLATIYRAMKMVLVVTFSYDVPAPSTPGGSFVSRRVAVVVCSGSPPENSANPKLKVDLDFFVPEANPVLKQSGLAIDYGTTYGGGMAVIAGSQGTAQTYAADTSHGHQSHHSFTHRVDSGARYGTGLTLVRGKSKLTLTVVESGLFASCGYTGFLLLSYVCDTPAAGDFAKTRTYRLQQSTSATALGETTGPSHARSGAAAKVPTFPAAWALASPIGYDLKVLSQSDSIELRSVRLLVGTLSGELPASSFFDLGHCDIQSCAGYGYSWAAVRFVDVNFRKFHRWASDPDAANRFDPTQQRNFRVSTSGNSVAARMMMEMIIDWHNQRHVWSGTVERGDDPPSGIEMGIHRSDTKELVATATTDADGAFSAYVYDPTLQYYAQGLQNSEHMGRSPDQYPTAVAA